MNNQFYYGFFDELEKVAFTPAAQKLIGAGIGGAAGGLSTRRKPGESNSDYAKRTALMAGGGAAAGFGGVMGARKLMSKMKADKLMKTRGEIDKGVKGVLGLGSIGIGLAGKQSATGKGIKGAQNVLGSDLASNVIKGKASGADILEGLGRAASDNQKGIGAMFSNYGKRKQYNKALAEFNAGGSRTDAELSAFKKQLKKKLGMSGRTSSFGQDLGNLLSGNKVRMGKTEAQMNFDKVQKDALGMAMGGTKTEKVRNFLGRQDSIKFTQGSARKAETNLNKALTRIQNSDLLTDEQKTNMTKSVIGKFEKQFNVKVDAGGSMAGRSISDRIRATGASFFGDGNKYTIRSKGDKSYGLGRGFFTGEKVAHVANDILKKHGY